MRLTGTRRNYEPVRMPYPRSIDADGHILEPPDLWEEYLEEAHKPRAIRLLVNDEGLEYLDFGGVPQQYAVPGLISVTAGTMGIDEEVTISAENRYADNVPFGAGDPKERLERLDDEGIERAILYPTLGLGWECEVTDPVLTYAYARAYNRWIADFCRDSGGRLVAAAHIPLLDAGEAARELERAVLDGCKGGFVLPWTHTRKPHGHVDHDPFWQKAVELDVPIAIHPSPDIPGMPNNNQRFETLSDVAWYRVMFAPMSVQSALIALLASGVLERFPTLTVGILESQAGWLPTMLDRMDDVAEHDIGKWFGAGAILGSDRMSMLPSEYFRRQCFISADPGERALSPANIEIVGADRVVWASDFPHPDHPPEYTTDIVNLIEPHSEDVRRKILAENVVDLYHLGSLT